MIRTQWETYWTHNNHFEWNLIWFFRQKWSWNPKWLFEKLLILHILYSLLVVHCKEEFRNLSILSFYLKSFLVPVSFQNYYTKLGAIEQEGEFFENYTYFTRKLAPKHLKMGHLSVLPPLTTQFLSCPILSVKHCIATVNKLRSNK